MNYSYAYPRPSLTADILPIRFHKGQLQILLIKRAKDPYANHFALPGGFADEKEEIIEAAKRELLEETGVSDGKLYEVGSYSSPNRDPRGWTISIAFLCLLPENAQASAGDDAEAVQWVPLYDPLPELAFDHAQIIEDAKKKMKEITLSSTLMLSLLTLQFRHRQMRHLYNQIWQRNFEPREIKAWALKCQLLEKVGPSRYQISSNPNFVKF
jgi:8-oxo-dGTP diphosphatase